MKHHRLAWTIVYAATFGSTQTPVGGLAGSHTDLPRWCGKPYEAGSPNYDPGGQLYAPSASNQPLLLLQIEPRYSIYDSSEQSGDFIVDASITRTLGDPYGNSSFLASHPHFTPDSLAFLIHIEDVTGFILGGAIEVNTTGNLIPFDFTALKPQLAPYTVDIYAYATQTQQFYKASSELYYLPAKNSGSTVKVDNLNGGMLVANNVTNYAFEPLLPFGFYTSCSGYLQTTYANITAYQNLGFNSINPVCDLVGQQNISYIFDWMDEANLWYQFDMRGSFMNLTQTSQQVEEVKDRANLLHWYTADEPDGDAYALNQTRITYDLVKREDPYHPIALVLNCQNFYYEDYASGADIVMEDAYPVGIDATHSTEWDTACNSTYGDCGCDNCAGVLQDVSARLDDLRNYQAWLGQVPKPLYAVLQAFSSSDYWSRNPTPAESWVMMLLAFNHRAKGIMSWLFPSSDVLNVAHGQMAKVASNSPVRDFLLGADPANLTLPGFPSLDVAYWADDGDEVLVSLANPEYASAPSASALPVQLPFTVSKIVATPWGNVTWSVENGALMAHGVGALATSLVIVEK